MFDGYQKSKKEEKNHLIGDEDIGKSIIDINIGESIVIVKDIGKGKMTKLKEDI